MKKAAGIMYILGIIGNFLVIGMVLLCLILSLAGSEAVVQVVKEAIAENAAGSTEAQIAEITNIITASFNVFLIIALILYIVTVILALVAKKAINDGKKGYAPHIILIVIGAFGNAFYVLGGIFGLVVEAQENKK